ncbi:MAG: type IV pilin protein [Candidatus Avelusimicrobium sp.]|uniref:type IV pilin protein n=1 Tax=Candidatus Avelusimicrobium sp. TaxID=3048833 RepID=UPI003F03B4D0
MNNKGFTLIELLVVVLILGILAAMAMPQYFKAVERSRMSEAVQLLANIAQSEQRKYMQINNYTANFRALDVTPKNANSVNAYCTKGTQPTADEAAAIGPANNVNKCGNGNGFIVRLDGTALNTGIATATRTGANALQYAYSLSRYYGGQGTLCTSGNDNGKELCADFCGIDALASGKAGCCSDGTYSGLDDTTAGECKAPAALN